jgi:hypothetical protein
LASQTEIKQGKEVQDKWCLEPNWGSLEKGIDPELVLQQGQVSRFKERDADRSQQVREWLQSH